MKHIKNFEAFSPLPIWMATGMLNRDEGDEDNEDKPCKKCEIGHYRKTQMTKSSGELECDNCDDKINRY